MGTAGINTVMADDLSTLTPALLTNFITVRFPAIDRPQTMPKAGERRRLDERLIVWLHRAGIRMALTQAGRRRFLDHMDADPAGRWRIHIFCADQDAISLVAGFTNGVVGPGDPSGFDARAFIEQRLTSLEERDQLKARDPWWADQSATAGSQPSC